MQINEIKSAASLNSKRYFKEKEVRYLKERERERERERAEGRQAGDKQIRTSR